MEFVDTVIGIAEGDGHCLVRTQQGQPEGGAEPDDEKGYEDKRLLHDSFLLELVRYYGAVSSARLKRLIQDHRYLSKNFFSSS
jgi:hypothetical protein